MKQLHKTTFTEFYKTNEFVAHTSPMRTHYYSRNPIERAIWQRKLAWMKSTLATVPHTRVIDIGCGDGGLVQTTDPASAYTGVDISPTQLAHFKHHVPSMKAVHPGSIKLVEHDVTTLPFKANSFDLALACDVLEHVMNPAKVVREIKRVLTPRGYALFSIPNEPVWQAIRIASLRWPPRSPDHLYFITPDVITREFPNVVAETFLPFPVPGIHLIHLMLVAK